MAYNFGTDVWRNP